MGETHGFVAVIAQEAGRSGAFVEIPSDVGQLLEKAASMCMPHLTVRPMMG